MTLSRRSLLPLAGLAATGITVADASPQYDPMSYGLMVRMTWVPYKRTWMVVVPDWDAMDNMGWYPGMALMWRHEPVESYLKQIEIACGLTNGAA